MKNERRRGPWVVSLLVALLFHLGVAAIPLDAARPTTDRLEVDRVVEVAISRSRSAPGAPPTLEASDTREEPPPRPATPAVRPRQAPRPSPHERTSTAVSVETTDLPSHLEAATEPDPSPEPASTEVGEPMGDSPDSPAPEAAPTVLAETGVMETTTPAADRPMPELPAYGRMLALAIQAEERYPTVARRMRLQGVVHLRVGVLTTGELSFDPVVLRSSGVDVLDREAIRMVRAAAPFPPLPAELAGRSAEFPVPIRFELR